LLSIAKSLVAACIFLMLAGSPSINAAPPGFVEGHLKIISPKEVELADGNAPAITAENYADYPLVILNQDGKRSRASHCGREWKLSYCISASD
jgi:hypothetical protein